MLRRLTITLPFALAACSAPPSLPPGNAEQHSDVRLERVTLKTWRGDTLRVDGTADTLELDRASSHFAATTNSIRLRERGLTLTAPRASGELQARTVDAEGGVRGVGRDGLQGETDRAHYDGAAGADGKASATTPVTVESPGMTLHAGGFDFDVANQQCDFSGPVTTRVRGETP